MKIFWNLFEIFLNFFLNFFWIFFEIFLNFFWIFLWNYFEIFFEYDITQTYDYLEIFFFRLFSLWKIYFVVCAHKRHILSVLNTFPVIFHPKKNPKFQVSYSMCLMCVTTSSILWKFFSHNPRLTWTIFHKLKIFIISHVKKYPPVPFDTQKELGIFLYFLH